MQKSKIVIALGGNALGITPEEQMKNVEYSAKKIVDLIEEGYQVIVGHGNGPQVGMIQLAMEEVNMPFPECGAMSQGYIGYHIQQAISKELEKRNIDKGVVSLITQVEVDENDPGFLTPTKPIGAFVSKEKALQIEKEKGYIFKEDSGRGYRRVVASPKPKAIVELSAIQNLVEDQLVVIAAGGGGIPVIETKEGKKGVAAVIDKDLSCAKLAEELNAELLVILTAVDKVAINFNKPDEKALDRITVSEAKDYIAAGEFGKGSMEPKIQACIEFVTSGENRKAYITSLDKAVEALQGKEGTLICK